MFEKSLLLPSSFLARRFRPGVRARSVRSRAGALTLTKEPARVQQDCVSALDFAVEAWVVFRTAADRIAHWDERLEPMQSAPEMKTTAEIRAPAPTAGRHTDELLTELGLTAPEIATLRKEGAIG